MARILLGVSGGIAAYKSLELVRLATAAGHAVRVVQIALVNVPRTDVLHGGILATSRGRC